MDIKQNPQSNNYKSKYIANLPKEEPGCFSNFFAGVLTVLSYILLVIAFPFCLYTVKEYERGVIFRLGRLVGAKGPGTDDVFHFNCRLKGSLFYYPLLIEW